MIWHLGWAIISIIGLIIVLFLPASLTVQMALICGAIPGISVLGLVYRNTPATRQILIWGWALFSLASICLTGGIVGPMAAWVAAPLLAAIALNQRVLISLGAALSLVSIVIAAFLSWSHSIGMADDHESRVLSVLSSVMMVIGLGTALMPALRLRIERAEDAEESRIKLLTLLKEQPGLILSLDTDFKIVSAYGEAPQGMILEDLMDDGLAFCLKPADRPRLSAALSKAANDARSDVQVEPIDGHFIWSLTIRRGEGGRLFVLITDATKQEARIQNLENARFEAEALSQTKSRFIANMSHELRTPLNAVLGFSDIMRQSLFGPLPEKYREYSQLIFDSGQHVLNLVNDLLDMAKIEAHKYELRVEIFDINEALSQAVGMIRGQASAKGIALDFEPSPEILMVEADRRAIKQIGLNLLSNAIKFTPTRGRVAFKITRQDALGVCLEVEDNGMGIEPEALSRLGRPFEQAGNSQSKAMGTGLGLSLVKSLCELHRGQMRLESQVGKGTRVIITLPIRIEVPDNLSEAEAQVETPVSRAILDERLKTPNSLEGFIVRKPD